MVLSLAPSFLSFDALVCHYLLFSGVHVGVEESGNPTETKLVPQGPVLPVGPIPDGALAHMMETGEAGAPGIIISSKPPKWADGSMSTLKGFAGAPGEI